MYARVGASAASERVRDGRERPLRRSFLPGSTKVPPRPSFVVAPKTGPLLLRLGRRRKDFVRLIRRRKGFNHSLPPQICGAELGRLYQVGFDFDAVVESYG